MSEHDTRRPVLYAVEAEQSVIGGLLLDNDAIDRIGDLRAEHFYRADHRMIFGKVTAMIAAGGADMVTVYAALQASGKAEQAGGLTGSRCLPEGAAMTRRVKSRAAAARRFAYLMRTSGMPLPAELVQDAIARGERLDAEARAEREEVARALGEKFAGCLSVTAVAKDLGLRRTDLFRWLEREGWLYRDEDGWQATHEAVDAEWIVQRGPASIRWAQIAPEGRHEIARRLGLGA